jgi:hypothetical protein
MKRMKNTNTKVEKVKREILKSMNLSFKWIVVYASNS